VIGTLWQPVYVVLKVGRYSPFSQMPMIALTNLKNLLQKAILV
jgi:hypothetical protein